LYRPPRATLALVAALIILSSAACAAAAAPWETSMPVTSAIHSPDGTAVTCEQVLVERIVARQTPAFFVVRGLREGDAAVVVLCRPPIDLARGQSVDVSGTISTLPSGERAILNPTISGYFDSHGRPLAPLPPFGVDPWLGEQRQLTIPTDCAAPADPSGPVDSIVTAQPAALARFATIASLLAARPAVLTPVELSCPDVTVYCSNGQTRRLTLTRTGDTGTAGCTFADLPGKRNYGPYSPDVKYAVSAQCAGCKIRTLTDLAPGATVGLYLVPLRKIYVTTDNTYISACAGGYDPTSTTITAHVVDGAHEDLPGVAVHFRTDKGSFYSDHVEHTFTVPAQDNLTGTVTATLYAVRSESGNAVVEASDDSAPVEGDNPNADPFKYDWEQLADDAGNPITVYVQSPSQSLSLSPSSIALGSCDAEQGVCATLTVCGELAANETIHFTTTVGVFDETGARSADALTDSSGAASVTLVRSSSQCGSGTITARWLGGTANASAHVSIDGWKVELE